MKRIIIEISILSDENWRLINRFINKCRHIGDFTNEDFDALSNVTKICYHEVERQEDVVHAYGSDLSFVNFNNDLESGVDFSFAIIYVKQDDSADFSLIMPYFVRLAQTQYKDTRVTFGIDITHIGNKDEYIYKFGQILNFISLPKPIVGIRSFYYIYWSKNDSQRKIAYNFPNKASNSSKNEFVSSRRFLAILKIDPNVLPLFSWSWSENINEDNQTSETFKWVKKSISRLDERLMHIKPLQNDKFNSIFEEWFVKAYLFSCVDKVRNQKSMNSNAYQALKMTLHEYSTNIYELVQNIIFHTEEKRGLLSILFNKKKNIPSLLLKKIPNISIYDDDDRFVEIGLYDYGRIGIVEKFGKKGLTLQSFFNPQEVLPTDDENIDYLSLRYSAHLGIKTFVSSVTKYNGYFSVESNIHDGIKARIENCKSGFDYKENIDSFTGTHYKIILPVKESEFLYSFEPVQSTSIIDILKSNVTMPLVPTVIAREIFSDDQFVVDDKIDQNNKISQAGNLIIEKSLALFNNNPQIRDVCVDMEEYEIISPNQFFKLIAYIQLGKLQFEKIIFVNLLPEIVDAMCSIVLNLSNQVASKKQPIWSNDHAVVLIDTDLKVRIFCGETKSDISYINCKLKNFYVDRNNTLSRIGDNCLDSSFKKHLDRFVMPYDCLIGSVSKNPFLCYVNKVLDTPLDDHRIGCLVDMPTRIGSKLYIDHFYEADFLFQNSFFAERFAFFAAREIIPKVKSLSHKIILVGYNYYSEVLVNRIKDYINFCSPTQEVCVVTAVPQENTNSLTFRGCSGLQEQTLYDVVTIVPIGSTLSTIDKIIGSFSQSFGKYEISYIYNYCSILIRDGDEKKEVKSKAKHVGITEKEKVWRWANVGENMVETSFSNAKEVHFLLAKRSKWHYLIDEETFPCRKASPVDGEEKYNFWNEKYVNQTRNSALNIRDYMSFPIAAIPNPENTDYYNLHREIMAELSPYIYFGHILHKHGHHRYYFDINNYILKFEEKSKEEKENTKLKKWLYEDLKKDSINIYDNQYINVIVTPAPDNAPYVSNLINEYVFDNNAYVLFLNIKDYHENVKIKHSFFKQLVSIYGKDEDSYRVRFHFVDQAMVTGESYLKTKSHMAAILGNLNFKFYDIITILNRLPKDKYDEIANGLSFDGKCGIFSFTHFFILPSKLPDTDCSLCRLRDYFENLKAYSVIKNCRDVIEVNKSKYNEQHFLQHRDEREKEKLLCSVSARRRYVRRMEWRDRLFYEISLLYGYKYSHKDVDTQQVEKHVMEKLRKVYDECKNIDDKIPYLKAISFPPLSEYIIIRKFAFHLMLKELKVLLKKEKPQMYDFFFLKVLLKHLAMLGSNALVRQEVIYGSCQLYVKVRNQLSKEIINIRTSLSEKQESYKERLQKKKNGKERMHSKTLFEEIDDNLCFEKHNSAPANVEEDLEQISKLREKLDYINEYTNINDDMVDLKEIEEIVNGENKMNNFLFDLHFYIKIATHLDESKSFWLGEMLRRGKEIKASEFDQNYKAKKTILFNDIFKSGSQTNEILHLLAPLLFYDNTSIIRKTLDDFEKELQNNKALKNRFYGEQGDFKDFKSFKEDISMVVFEYKNLIKENYYYEWFKLFLQKEGDGFMDRSNDNIPLIQKCVEVLYGRLMLKELLNQSHEIKESFDKNAEKLLEIFSSIMDSQAAFIVIKPEKSKQLCVLTSYVSKDGKLQSIESLETKLYDGSFYCKKLLLGEDNLQKGRPFVMRRDISLEGESCEGFYNRATFLTLNRNKSDGNRTSDVLVGLVVFLYKDNYSNTRFMIEKQELGRLLLLLKPESDAYVSHVANEHSFEVWITQRHLARLTLADNHELALNGWDFDNLSLDNLKKIYNGIIMFSNVVVRHLYANLIYKGKIALDYKSISLSDLFDDKFISLLQEIVEQKWGTYVTLTVSPPPKGVFINGMKTVLRSYIIQLMFNAYRHADCTEISISFNDGLIEIRNDVLKKVDNLEKLIAQFNRKYTEDEMDRFVKTPNYINHYGFTLLTLHYYCKSVGIRCDMGFKVSDNKHFFYVKLIFN